MNRFRTLALALLVCLSPGLALAQQGGLPPLELPPNTVIGNTQPVTAFGAAIPFSVLGPLVLQSGIPLATGSILVGGGANLGVPQVVSGDCTLSFSGVMICTKSNGTPFAIVATSGSASDLIVGTLPAARLPANAIWIGRQTFCASGCTSTGGAYAPTSGTNAVDFTCVGGGGAGGGAAATGAAQAAIGTGGSAGATVRGRFISGFSGVTITIGAGGTAGTTGANPGNNGGDTTIAAPISITAGGGIGGSGGALAGAGGAVQGAAGGTPTGGDIRVPGQASRGTVYNITSAVQSSEGASSTLGAGGTAISTQTGANGNAGAGFGSGGSGGANTASQVTTRTGGPGAGGFCVADEYR